MFKLFYKFCLIILLVPHVSGCGPYCREERLREIKSKIMSAVKLSEEEIQAMSKPDNKNQFMRSHKDLISDNFGSSEVRDVDALETKLFIAEDPFPESNFDTKVAQFRLHLGHLARHITEARLFVYLDIDEQLEEARNINVNVYERMADMELGQLIATKTVSTNNGSFVTVDIDPAFPRGWTSLNFPGLYVEALLDGRNVAVHPQDLQNDKVTGWEEDTQLKARRMLQLMMLGLTLDMSTNTRHRRSSHVCAENGSNSTCCRRSLEIDFERIGWGFVVAPRSFNAYMCAGTCNSPPIRDRGDGHSLIMHRAAPESRCCHATEFIPLRVVYKNPDGSLTVTVVNSLVATKCACS